MTLKNASSYFENLATQTNKKSEIRIYQEFIKIITSLEKRKLTRSEIQSIEIKLDSLELNSLTKNNKRYFKKALRQFIEYIKDTFHLTPKRYHTKMGMALGASFGIVFGIVFLSSFERSMGISLGWLIGMIIGLTIGQSMDAKAMSEGRII